MARYTGPVCRLCRRDGMKLFLKGTRCDTSKCGFERREQPPGQQQYRRGKMTDYGLHLREKQKVKHYYGVLERQFPSLFPACGAHQGQHRRRVDEPAGTAARQRRASPRVRSQSQPGPPNGQPWSRDRQRPAGGRRQLLGKSGRHHPSQESKRRAWTWFVGPWPRAAKTCPIS